MKILSFVIFNEETKEIIAVVPHAIESSLKEESIVLKVGYTMELIDDADPRLIDVEGKLSFIENEVC